MLGSYCLGEDLERVGEVIRTSLESGLVMTI